MSHELVHSAIEVALTSARYMVPRLLAKGRTVALLVALDGTVRTVTDGADTVITAANCQAVAAVTVQVCAVAPGFVTGELRCWWPDDLRSERTTYVLSRADGDLLELPDPTPFTPMSIEEWLQTVLEPDSETYPFTC